MDLPPPFGLTNLPAAAHNINRSYSALAAAGEARLLAGEMPSQDQLRAMGMSESEARGLLAVLGMEDEEQLEIGLVDHTIDAALMQALARSKVKHNSQDIIAITRTPRQQIVWLEKGTAQAGFQHIWNEHGADFLRQGISQKEFPLYIKAALEAVKIVGYQGRGTGRPIYEFTYHDKNRKIAITVGSNGFIVGANPK